MKPQKNAQSSYYRNIASYYDRGNFLYKYGWYQGDSLGLHFGFAPKGLTDHQEALHNQYRYIIQSGNITSTSRVLDAGCGVGGASIFIAKHTGATLIGITISHIQITDAQKNIRRQHLTDQITIGYGDYLHTPFPDGSFDVIFGLESICYAEPKSAFLKEAYRLLKSGGRLVITDGFTVLQPKTAHDKTQLRNFLSGWKLHELIDIKTMCRLIHHAGFRDLRCENKTDEIDLSLQKMAKLVRLHNCAGWILRLISGWLYVSANENAIAMEAAIEGRKAGWFGYFALVATKP